MEHPENTQDKRTLSERLKRIASNTSLRTKQSVSHIKSKLSRSSSSKSDSEAGTSHVTSSEHGTGPLEVDTIPPVPQLPPPGPPGQDLGHSRESSRLTAQPSDGATSSVAEIIPKSHFSDESHSGRRSTPSPALTFQTVQTVQTEGSGGSTRRVSIIDPWYSTAPPTGTVNKLRPSGHVLQARYQPTLREEDAAQETAIRAEEAAKSSAVSEMLQSKYLSIIRDRGISDPAGQLSAAIKQRLEAADFRLLSRVSPKPISWSIRLYTHEDQVPLPQDQAATETETVSKGKMPSGDDSQIHEVFTSLAGDRGGEKVDVFSKTSLGTFLVTPFKAGSQFATRSKIDIQELDE